jgi:predicted nucleic acid-binding protein
LKLADSDILIDYLKHREPGAGLVSELLSRRELATTAITRFEVLRGAITPKALDEALDLFSKMDCIPLDVAAADAATAIDRDLRQQGERIETPDTLIAGIAIANGLSLLTRSIRHFNRIDGLVIETV